MTVVFINLDGFKLVNDSLNHKAGDELLKVMAERMSQCLRSVAPSCGQAAMNSQTFLYGRPGERTQVAPARKDCYHQEINTLTANRAY